MNPSLERLIEINRELRERIEGIERALMSEIPPHVGPFTRTEALVLGLLIKRRRASREQIAQVLWAGDPSGGGQDKSIDVFVSKIRKKVPAGVEIRCIWGVGYELPPASIEILRKGLAA